MLLVASICLFAVAPAALAVSGTFNGKTSQHHAVTVTVSRNRVVYKRSGINWSAKCAPRGAIPGITDFGGRLKDGKFGGHATYTSSLYGIREVNTATVQFAIKGGTAKGSFYLTAVLYSRGAAYSHCETGKITFTAES